MPQLAYSRTTLGLRSIRRTDELTNRRTVNAAGVLSLDSAREPHVYRLSMVLDSARSDEPTNCRTDELYSPQAICTSPQAICTSPQAICTRRRRSVPAEGDLYPPQASCTRHPISQNYHRKNRSTHPSRRSYHSYFHRRDNRQCG